MDPRIRMARLGLLYAVIFGSIAILYPYLSLYLDLRGFSPSSIGLILGMMEIAGLAAPFALSRFADRTGHFRSIMALMILMAAAGLAILHRSHSFPVILLAVMVYGFFFKPISSMSDALSGRVLIDSTVNYGRVRVWGTVSFVLVSLYLQGTGVMESDSPRRYMTAFFVALAAIFIIIPAAPGAPLHDNASMKANFGLRGMPKGYYSFLLIGFIGNIGFAVYQAFGALYFAEIVGVGGVSGLFALASITEIPSLFFGGRILGSLGHRRMLFIAQGTCLLRLVILALFPYALPVALSQLTHAFCFGFFLISGVDWVNRIVPVRRRALGMGLFIAVTFSGSQLVGSALGGYLLEFGGFSLMFGIGALFPLLGMIWLLADRRIGGRTHLP